MLFLKGQKLLYLFQKEGNKKLTFQPLQIITKSFKCLFLFMLKMIVRTVCFLLVYVSTLESGGGVAADEKKCDLFKGRWVWDNTGSYPMYNGIECPFINSGLNCQKNGRPDNTYLNFMWQPHSCSLSRSVFFSPVNHTTVTNA